MAIDADQTTLGHRIAEARAAAGLTQQDLGVETSIERSALNKIENGARRVTAFELSEIARVLKRRMDWFFLDPTPAIVSRRQREGTSNRTIDRRLEEITREVEMVRDLRGDGLSIPPWNPLPEPQNADDAENLAATVRRALLLDSSSPVLNVARTCEALGLLTFSLPLGPDVADGASVLLPEGGVAIVNSTNDVGRRRLTVAHELGHFVIADTYTVDDSVLLVSDSGREALLDRFARAFLAPAESVAQFWNNEKAKYDERIAALRTASHFNLDYATLARRLLDVGVIDEDQAQGVRSVRAAKPDYAEYSLHVPVDLEGTTLPQRYEVAVVQLYRAEKLSRERALDLLLGTYQEDDLPHRDTRSEGETWQFFS